VDESASETNLTPVADSERGSRRDTHSVTKVMFVYETVFPSFINVGNDHIHATVVSVSLEIFLFPNTQGVNCLRSHSKRYKHKNLDTQSKIQTRTFFSTPV